jgi:ribosome-associated protein
MKNLDSEIQLEYMRASGPGGQNVNKVATAAQLRFDIFHSPSLASETKGRLILLAGKRVNREGVLILESKRFRTQEQNREDVIAKFYELIQKANVKPKIRKKTKASKASKEKRLKSKKRDSEIKKLRGKVSSNW